MFERAVVLSRLDREEAVRLAGKLASQLREQKVKVEYEAGLAGRLGIKGGVDPSKVEADLAVIVGGDGTIIRAVHRLRRSIPLFTVSMGRVGFLAEATPGEASAFLSEVLRGNYVEDRQFMVEADVRGIPPALNELKIGSGSSRMVELSVYVDGFRLGKDKVDGVLVSTPSGASAYAFSVGGSLVDPRLEALIIAPIYPLSTNFKPFITPSTVEVTVKPESETPLLVVADGLKARRLQPPRPVKVKRSRRHVVFLRRGFTFYERVKRRLSVTCLT